MLASMVFFFLTSLAFKTVLLTHLLLCTDKAEKKNKFAEAARTAHKGKAVP